MRIQRKITAQADSENLSRFFSDIRNYEPITKEEEKKLIIKFQKEDDQEALNKLIKANIKFVVSIAKKYQGGGVPILDLISEGSAGMIKAAREFDTKRDLKFFSYAVWWIRIKIFTSFDYNNRTIQLPANREMNASKIKKEISALEQKLNRYPTIEELHAHCEALPNQKTKLSENDIKEAILHSSYMPSLQDNVSTEEENEDTFEDILASNTLGVDDIDKSNSLNLDLTKFLFHLSQLEYDIIVLSLGLNGEDPIRNDDLGGLLNIKKKDAVKIKMNAMKRLRKLRNIGTLREYL